MNTRLNFFDERMWWRFYMQSIGYINSTQIYFYRNRYTLINLTQIDQSMQIINKTGQSICL